MSLVYPSNTFSLEAHVKSLNEHEGIYKRALNDPALYWLECAMKFYWKKNPTYANALRYNFDSRNGPIFVKWFEDGVTNICYNALDRIVDGGYGDKSAILWEGNCQNDTKSLTYSELLKQVKRVAIMLQRLGIRKGDFVAIYMPMVPEILQTMLACARIGAVHSVIFGGFSARSLAERIMDANCKILITCDGVWRGSKLIELYSAASKAMELCEQHGYKVNHCVVLRHVTTRPSCTTNGLATDVALPGVRPATNVTISMEPDRDLWWHDIMSDIPNDIDCPVEWMCAEDPLFILYTSGSTGHPKGIVHTTGGYMVYVGITFYFTFDFHENDVYWCTADAGWITGHSYLVYGPLLNGATSVVFEGIPTWPDPGRCWAIVDRYKVTKFYTAPTAIRVLLKAGDDYVNSHSRTTLKVLGSVGEPINASAWEWYYRTVGNECCPIVDTYWQTETGGHLITSIPGAVPMKPGCATRPFFGIDARVLSDTGQDVTEVAKLTHGVIEGHLVIAKPWPGMMRTIHKNHQLFENLYFKRFPGYYVTGDGAKVDEDGYFWITGRLDDMLNVSGHLISTAEIENVLLLCPKISEAAVVSRYHSVKGECLHCFVTLKDDRNRHSNGGNVLACIDPMLRSELIQLVRTQIGPFAAPDYIQEAPALPKTRSGKIMRRILRKIANQDYDFGDTSTMLDPACVDTLIELSKYA